MTVDWLAAGAKTSVNWQAYCGSCWAFSSTGALESAHFIEFGELLSFSEQQLVDCDTGSYGCSGGTFSSAFDYWMTTNVATEDTYPYIGEEDDCNYDSSMSFFWRSCILYLLGFMV